MKLQRKTRFFFAICYFMTTFAPKSDHFTLIMVMYLKI